MKIIIQRQSQLLWNSSIPDTLGTAKSVQIKGGVLISGVACTLGTMHSVLIEKLFLWRDSTVDAQYIQ